MAKTETAEKLPTGSRGRGRPRKEPEGHKRNGKATVATHEPSGQAYLGDGEGSLGPEIFPEVEEAMKDLANAKVKAKKAADARKAAAEALDAAMQEANVSHYRIPDEDGWLTARYPDRGLPRLKHEREKE